MTLPGGQGAGSPPDAVAMDFWKRYRMPWHLTAAVNVALVGFLVAVSEGISPAGRWLGGAILLALAGWYLLVGVRALAGRGSRLGVGYLLVAIIGFGCLLAVTPAAGFLLFTLSPQVFTMVVPWRLRVPLLLVLYAELAAANLWHGGLSRDALVDTVVWAVVPLVGSLLIGTFVTGVIQQSRQRRELIDELVRTRAELAAERHEAGIRAERRRVAAEVHDTIAQGCTSILMLTQAARAALRDVGPQALRHLDLIERAARDNLAEARALVGALRPPDLADRSLADALARLADRHTGETGVPVAVTVTGDAAGPVPDVDLVLLRAAQESLANVRRHAAATAVRIALERGGGTAAIEVIDDGRGFEPATATGGYGLAGMRERAAAFGGACTVRSAPGSGTTVRVTLPEPSVPTVPQPDASQPDASQTPEVVSAS